jgi:hypothetical protein
MDGTFLRRADYDTIARKAIGIFTDVERAHDGFLRSFGNSVQNFVETT